jgi:hypothetical protein
MQEPLFAAL